MSPMEQLAKQEYDRGYSDGKSDFFAAGVAEGEMRARQRMIANRVVANQHPFAASGKQIDHIADADKMVDTDGENKALRCFLMVYGTPGLTVGAMQAHLVRCGYPLWPAWVDSSHQEERLTKAGAQQWIRFLLAEPVKHESVMDYEHICALREIEQIQAGDSYFFVRPENDTPTSRKMFFQGFERGFHKGLKYAAQVDAKAIRSERYFCQRCGKRVGDKNGALEGIHTCTPPEDCRGMK